jgi:hypothetical protein
MPKREKNYQLCVTQNILSSWLSLPSAKTMKEKFEEKSKYGERKSQKRRPVWREDKKNQDARVEGTEEWDDESDEPIT